MDNTMYKILFYSWIVLGIIAIAKMIRGFIYFVRWIRGEGGPWFRTNDEIKYDWIKHEFWSFFLFLIFWGLPYWHDSKYSETGKDLPFWVMGAKITIAVFSRTGHES